MASALRMRREAGLPLESAICVYDLAERLGIEVRFTDLPSMEGMYCREPRPTIILSSLRPIGRRSFTCAHELGHHSSGDGTRIDQLVGKPNPSNVDPVEFAADCFAGALLMPKMAVRRAFNLRHWDIGACTPGQIYAISNYFGVGYTTLIHHMRGGLQLLSQTQAAKLLKATRGQAQAEALGWQSRDKVWVVDSLWTGRPIDVEAGDFIFVRDQVLLEGACVFQVRDKSEGILIQAGQPGIGRLSDNSGWSAFVRVSRTRFVGRGVFRHFEEEVDEGAEVD